MYIKTLRCVYVDGECIVGFSYWIDNRLLSRVKVIVTLRLAVYRQSVFAKSPSRPTTNIVFFQLNTCGYSPHVTFSLTRGWVCHLQLLLALASAVILWSESRGTHDHILLSQIRNSPNLEGQVPVFIVPRNRGGGYTLRHWVSFLATPTTRRDTVDVFDPASTQVMTAYS
jgi:hypothetical protein